MTFPVADNDAFARVTASDGQTLLTCDFPILAEDDFALIRNRDGIETVLALGDDYTVAGVQVSTGFSVTLDAGAAEDDIFAFVRMTEAARVSGRFSTSGSFNGEAVNDELDRLTMLAQEARRDIGRTVGLAKTDPATDLTLQPVAVRAGFVTVFDEAGKLVASTVTAAQLAVIAIASDAILLLQQLVASLSGDYLFAQPADKVLNAPAGDEAVGYRALVYKAPTGEFSGKRGRVAVKTDTGWIFSPVARNGQRVFDHDTQLEWVAQNGWWNKLKVNKPGGLYQDFRDVPDGTTAMGMVIATGQVLDLQGAGNLSSINNGRYEPLDNSYLAFLFPYKELRMSITGMYRTGYLIGSLTLAAGTKVGGLIIAKMNHAEFLPQQQGDLSIWGGVRQTSVMGSPIGSLATADLQSHYRPSLDTSYPLHGVNELITNEMTIQGNVCRCYGDGRHFADSYRDDMISGSNGDDASGNKGYVYFQTGGTLSPNLPYIYEVSAEPLTPAEQLADPVLVPDSSILPQIKSHACPFTVATEVCRFTPTDGQTYAFQVDLEVHPDPGLLGPYAMATRSYMCLVKKYAGTILCSTPLQLYTEQTLTTGAGTVQLTVPLSLVISGNDVLLKATTARSGTDATAYDPVVVARITNRQGGAVFV